MKKKMKKIKFEYPKSSLAFFGGNWFFASFSGSSRLYWSDAPWDAGADISSRGVCDHFKG